MLLSCKRVFECSSLLSIGCKKLMLRTPNGFVKYYFNDSSLYFRNDSEQRRSDSLHFIRLIIYLLLLLLIS